MPRRPLPGKPMGAFEEIVWQTTLSRGQLKVLKTMRELGGRATVLQIAEKTGRPVKGVIHTLDVLESKGKVVRASYNEGDKTIWRVRTWEDVDHDHIREMVRRGGVW